MGRRGKLAPTVLKSKARRAEAAQLRMLGMDYRAIAAKMGVSVAWAHELVKSAADEMDQIAKESMEVQRRVELDRLDHATRILMSHVTQLAKADPSPSAFDQLIRVIERRCKILGLDAATQLMVQQQVSEKLPMELMKGLQAIKAALNLSDDDYERALHILTGEGPVFSAGSSSQDGPGDEGQGSRPRAPSEEAEGSSKP